MRILLIAAFATTVSGCAIFQKSERTAADISPAPARTASVTPTPFKPAFGAGAPVALVPCRNSAAFDDTCRRTAVSHERRGDMPAGENSEAFSDATTVALTQE